MIFNKTEKQEREYLQRIINILDKIINNTDTFVKEHVDTLAEYKEYLWSNKDIDPHEIRSMRESILNHFALGNNVINKRKRLGKIMDIPYFGRIDFKENKEGSQVLPIYIGVHSFYDPYFRKIIIYDWRAPVAGMFYDHELGHASYISPTEKLDGTISLKRQYRIRKGKMEYMIESSLTIHDDILQKELSSGSDDKMKNIVATIQREQNQIIRNEDAKVLIIQGVAGSGKTSIALHRIAYLLYTFKNSLSSNDILIISPNRVFADYISNVLPELGEENVPQTNMEQILSEVLNNKYCFQNGFEQIEELLKKPAEGFVERLQYKASFDFINHLDKFLIFVENNYFKARDVKLTKLFTIPAEFIEEQFRRFNRYPMRKRFEAMTDYILEMAKIQYKLSTSTKERNMLMKEIQNMFNGNNDILLYKDFFKWIGSPQLFIKRKNNKLEYADLAPLAYLHIALDGYRYHKAVKHLLIDEMQDYSPIQYKVLQKLFSCHKTILGDANQSVNPYASSNCDMVQKAFVNGEVMKLYKSYRSSFEIIQFARKIRKCEEMEAVARHGEKPQIIESENEQAELYAISGLIDDFKKSTYNSLGIICKTELLAKELADKLKPYTQDCYFISNQSSAFVRGAVVISAQMAKGLEFDVVIIPQINDKIYNSEIDRNMLYVAATRAMHKLALTYSGSISPMIEN